MGFFAVTASEGVSWCEGNVVFMTESNLIPFGVTVHCFVLVVNDGDEFYVKVNTYSW